jgi:ferredoxin
VNYLGERRVLTALEGETLLAVAQRHRYSYVDGACGGGGAPSEKLHKQGEWVEPKYGEGASCYFCHVVVAKAFKADAEATIKAATDVLGEIAAG